MDCETVARENIPERYLAGALDPQLREQWELHYFGCDHCAELLTTWQAIDQPLRGMAASIRQEIRPRKTTPRWLWAGAAIAAALVVGTGIKLTLGPEQNSPTTASIAKSATSAQWEELARLE